MNAIAGKKQKLGNATLENVKINFKNFEGKAGQFNAEGNRNFAVFLDTDIANQMQEDGWNIKWLDPRDPEDAPQAYIRVKVNFRGRPPRAFVVTSRNKTQLDEHTIMALDFADIASSDVIISAYHYDVNGKTGVTAYLQAIYCTIREDYLSLKYADVPDSGAAPQLEIEGEVIEEAEVVYDDPFEMKAIGE